MLMIDEQLIDVCVLLTAGCEVFIWFHGREDDTRYMILSNVLMITSKGSNPLHSTHYTSSHISVY